MRKTRAIKAAELKKRLQDGPSHSMTFLGAETGINLTDKQKLVLEAWLVRRYKLWADSWVLEPLGDLIKEVR